MSCCASGAERSAPAVGFDPPSSGRVAALAAAALVAVNQMSLTLAVNLSAPPPGTRRLLQLVLGLATLGVAALLARPLVRGAWQGVLNRRLRFEHLFLTGITGAFGVSVLSVARGEGPLYFEVASILLVVHALGALVGGASQARARARLARGARAGVERRARRVHGDSVREVPVGAVRIGDRVRVHPGERAPVDGRILDGAALVDRRLLFGESAPRTVAAGETLLAGDVVLDASVDLRCTAELGQRVEDRIEVAVQDALRRPSSLQRAADRFVAGFLPVVLAVAAGAGALAWFDGRPGAAWTVGLSVLLVACPCAIGFALPLGQWMGLDRVAAAGLVARSGEALEALAAVDVVILDKTGTLTEVGPPALRVLPGFEQSQLVGWVAALEATSAHPLARALAAGGSPRGTVELCRVVPGWGLEGAIRDERGVRAVRVGRSRDPDRARARLGSVKGAFLLDVEVDGRLAGVAALDERARPGLAELQASLDRLGVEVRLSSGDEADRVGRLGFLTFDAAQSPDDKRSLVARLRAEGRRVAFVGDGFNDAAALAEADVGVAVSEGAELAVNAADFVWLGQDLAALPRALQLSRRVRRIAFRNLGFAAIYNAAGMGVAAAGALHPVTAALLMVAASLTVTWSTVLGLGDGDGPGDEAEAAPAKVGAPEARRRAAPALSAASGRPAAPV